MNNLPERLRNQKYNATPEEIYADSMEAADEIEWLRGVIRTLDCLDPFTCGRGDYLCPSCEFSEEDSDG